MAPTKELNNDEFAVYDRQIRLWGLEAQNRLRNSNVFLYGLSPLGAEIGKNLMLCGLNGFTVADGQKVVKDEVNFMFDSEKSEGQNRAKAAYDRLRVLNPLVNLEAKELQLIDLTPDYLKTFDLVILADQAHDTILDVDAICREHKIRFIAGGIFGWTGYAFFDFDGFEFLVPAPVNHFVNGVENEDDGVPAKKAKTETEATITLEEDNAKIKKKFTYPSFQESMELDPDQITKKIVRQTKPGPFVLNRTLLSLAQLKEHNPTVEEITEHLETHAASPITPLIKACVNDDLDLVTDPAFPAAAAIVGGVLSQEAIKSLSQNDIPYVNFFAFNAVENMGLMYDLPLVKAAPKKA
uniref:ThiF domain-containing protein n=1 Tax=Panagrellus redivivus TaxID=6233 RepID=A0A7E4VGV9_PANRE